MITNWKNEVMMVPVVNVHIVTFPNGSSIKKKKYEYFPNMYFKTYVKKEIGLQSIEGVDNPSETNTHHALNFIRNQGMDVIDIRFLKRAGLHTHVFEIFVEISQS